jgi:flagellar biogenesis protein FliO
MHENFRWLRPHNRAPGAARRPSLKWLLLPPAIAGLLFLGPFRDELRARDVDTATPARSAPATTPPAGGIGDRIPETPGTWQVVSTLLGVLALGGVGLLLLRRMQRRTPARGGYLGLRQTLPLGARRAVHAIEFDDRILLVGECDGNLTILHASQDPRVLADERQVGERTEAAAEEDGAVPRDLVLPRPARAHTPAPPPPRQTTLRDFKALLERARTGAGT